MHIAGLKDLEKQATPRPWRADWGNIPDEPMWRSGGPVHECECEDCEGYCDEPGGPLEEAAARDAELLTTLRNLAPELLDLWDACNEMDGIGAEHPMRSFRAECVKTALNALNEKAATMAV